MNVDWNNALLCVVLIMLVLNLATSLAIMYKLIQHDDFMARLYSMLSCKINNLEDLCTPIDLPEEQEGRTDG